MMPISTGMIQFKFSKNVVIALVASLLISAYTPVSSMVSAQAQTDAKLQQLKQKATKEIDRRINDLKKSLAKLNDDVRLDNIGLSASLNENSGQNVSVAVSPEVKKNAKELTNSYITQLTELKDKVNATTSLTDMQALAKTIDSQTQLDQSVSVQASVTKAVESLTGVFDKLKSTASKIQSQINGIKSCAADGASATCDTSKGDPETTAKSAQVSLDSVKTIMSTIGSMLSSVIAILLSLVTTLVSMSGSLGSLSSLGNVSGNSSLGGLGSILSSFTAVGSQLDLASGLSSSAGSSLGSLSSITSLFNF